VQFIAGVLYGLPVSPEESTLSTSSTEASAVVASATKHPPAATAHNIHHHECVKRIDAIDMANIQESSNDGN
jgi:hypothetical protein